MASFDENSGDHNTPVNQTGTSSGAAAPAKSGSCLKIFLIVFAILVVLGIIALAGVGYVAWRVKKAVNVETGANGQMTLNTPNGKVNITGNGGKMTVQTPDGKMDLNTTETYTAADLGTDIYPGAQSVKGGMRMESPTSSTVTGIFVTTDSKDQVVTFYKAKFGSGASTFDTNDGAMITLSKGDQETVLVTITGKPSENEGKTKIVIVHTTNNKAP